MTRLRAASSAASIAIRNPIMPSYAAASFVWTYLCGRIARDGGAARL